MLSSEFQAQVMPVVTQKTNTHHHSGGRLRVARSFAESPLCPNVARLRCQPACGRPVHLYV